MRRKNRQLNMLMGTALLAMSFLLSPHQVKVSEGEETLYINTIAGTGVEGFSGDGGYAAQATFMYPFGVTVGNDGNIYIMDSFNNRVRKIDQNGIITTVAGNGNNAYSGDGGPAIDASLGQPYVPVVFDSNGNMFIADTHNFCIRKIDPNGIISTVAGSGSNGFSGDGGSATQATMGYLEGVAVDLQGNIYISDGYHHRIRKVGTNGIINTIAGTGSPAFYGDGGPATQANLYYPSSLVLDSANNLYVADQYNNRVRKIDTNGIITTVAGTGTAGFSGDGGLATQAKLSMPTNIFLDPVGNLYIAESGNRRIRKVDSSGIISTIAGNGIMGFSGDGGPATQAMLNHQCTISVDSNGNVYIADTYNNRIRVCSSNPNPLSTTVTPRLDNPTPQQGDTVCVQINVADVTDLYATSFDLAYDPNVLQFADPITEGSFLSQDGKSTSLLATDDPASGKLIVGISRLGDVSGVSGSGNLATVCFRVVGDYCSSSAISFTEAVLETPVQNGEISANWNGGTITVKLGAPSAPIIADPGARDQIDLGWGIVSGAGEYEIYRGNTSSDMMKIATTTGTTYSDSGCILPTLDYYYKIVAKSGDTCISDASPIVVGSITGLLGDINNDGKVNGRDLSTLARAFGSSCGSSKYNCRADLKRDCLIDGEDLSKLAADFGMKL